MYRRRNAIEWAFWNADAFDGGLGPLPNPRAATGACAAVGVV